MVSYSGGPVFIVLYTLGPTRQLVGRLPLSPKRITFRPKIAGAGQSTVLVEGSCEAVAPLVERFDIEPFSDFSAK